MREAGRDRVGQIIVEAPRIGEIEMAEHLFRDGGFFERLRLQKLPHRKMQALEPHRQPPLVMLDQETREAPVRGLVRGFVLIEEDEIERPLERRQLGENLS